MLKLVKIKTIAGLEWPPKSDSKRPSLTLFINPTPRVCCADSVVCNGKNKR